MGKAVTGKAFTLKILRYNGQDDEWYWVITVVPKYPRHDWKVEDETTHIYQDEAANEAYRWARRYFRSRKRRKKRV